MPIQRVPRYVLLFEQLRKVTPEHFDDLPVLDEAVKSISAVTNMLNESLRATEQRRALLRLQDMVNVNVALTRPGQLLIKEGKLVKVQQRTGALPILYWHLLTDMLIYSLINRISGALYKSRVIPLAHCVVSDASSISGHTKIDKECAFVLHYTRKSLIVVSLDHIV